MGIINFFRFNKKKRIRALRLEQEKNKKNEPRFANPYFPKEHIQKEEKPKDFKTFFLKKDGPAYTGIIFLLAACSLYIIFGTKYFYLKNIDIQGNKNITQEEIKNLLDNYLNQKKFYIIPNNNWFTINGEKAASTIKEGITNKFALAELSLDKKWPNTLQVNIKERIPGLVWISNDQYYYLDIDGMPSQKIEDKQGINADFPVINDSNNAPVEINKQVVSKNIIDFILLLEDKFPASVLKIKSYIIPKITCQEIQYKMEKIFEEEINKTKDNKLKEKKKEILKKFNKGEISLDESLMQLENLKKEEKMSNVNNEEANEFVKWETNFVPKECNYVKVNSEINVLTDDGFEIYFDSKQDIDKQIENLTNVLKQKIDNKEKLQYIDLRFIDRIYYK